MGYQPYLGRWHLPKLPILFNKFGPLGLAQPFKNR